MADKERKRILSGMRPTGKLHIGHYWGALENWRALQDEYECFYMVADWHAFSSDYEDPSKILENCTEMVIDWLAAGIDPEKATIFIQSRVPQHAELFLIFSLITPLAWAERNPTYKEQLQEIKDKDIRTYGFLGYPILQAADILVYNASLVPVGVDQLPHIELTREVARRFNFFYGGVFNEPGAKLTPTPKILGTDGRKMSKSYNNALFLSDTAEEMGAKVMKMFTDPAKLRKGDPGHPDECPVFALQVIYNAADSDNIKGDCGSGALGCVDCKRRLVPKMNEALAGIREKRKSFEKDKALLGDIIEAGNKRAFAEAEKMMEIVRMKVKLKA